jgi:MFS family permease
MRPNLAFAMLIVASMLCCIPMAMPPAHIVAFCSDLGILPSHGAAMLSLLLACAFVARQVWGRIADRIGGLRTVLFGSACQAVTITGFLLTQDELGLFTVAAVFGFGFSGIIPAYVLAIRQLYSASEAAWRVPIQLFFSGAGMALGGWLAGVIYDRFGTYSAAFATGIAFNLTNFAIIAFLVYRHRLAALRPAYG